MYQHISNRQEEFVQEMIEQPDPPPTAANVLPQPSQQQPSSQPLQAQGKLVLPAYDNLKYRTTSKRIPAVGPEQLARHTSTPSPTHLLAKFRYFWSKDPAYKVLFIAIGTVLIAAVVFASLVSTALLNNASLFGQPGMYSQNAPTAVGPTGTLDLHPKFPTPAGGKGSTSSSQPPQSTPVLQNTPDNTPTTEPSPTPNQEGQLALQITTIPAQVMNGSAVSVGISANQPNVSVELYIVYNVEPFKAHAGPGITDANDNATISWYVSVVNFGNARAYVTAIARDSNGQRVQSQTVTVQVVEMGFTG